MQNITTHFWVGSGWPSHGIWQPTLSRSNPHRWSRSEREKEDQLETIKRKERKPNLLHVRESLALEIKIKGAKNITWKISKKFAEMYWTYQKEGSQKTTKMKSEKSYTYFSVSQILRFFTCIIPTYATEIHILARKHSANIHSFCTIDF